MQHIIHNKSALLPVTLRALLPARLTAELEGRLPEGVLIEELHLRRGRAASITAAGKNMRLDTVLGGAEMDALLLGFCGGSLYAHDQTLLQGYLSFDGIRIGVCGRANVTGERVVGVSEVSAFVIRFPHPAPAIGAEIYELLTGLNHGGVLIFAPPAEGKTTLLRAVAARMAGGDAPRRVAVVDTRGELAAAATRETLLMDILSGYPRGLGISIAARTLAAELIVCDEIGDLAEAREILSVHSCGVPLLASAHGKDLGELLARPGIRLLHDAHCFGAYVRIRRRPDAFDFCYEITKRERVDALG